jgi:reverse gyrase
MRKKKKIYGICDRCGGVHRFKRMRNGWECQDCLAWYPYIIEYGQLIPVDHGDSPRHY